MSARRSGGWTPLQRTLAGLVSLWLLAAVLLVARA